MKRLYLALPQGKRGKQEEFLQERTAGTWRRHISIIELHLGEQHRDFNDGELESRARSEPGSDFFAIRSCTTPSLEKGFKNVRRYSKAKFNRQIVDWLESNHLGWRANALACAKRGPYRWADYSDWCAQFARVDSKRGLRVAAGILVQLRVATLQELAGWFDVPPAVDHHAFYLGSDPHSGDHGVINTLSARITGPRLTDAHKLPHIKNGSQIRLFSDGGWSGGESERRLECLYVDCEKKPNALPDDASVFMRFSYVTDVAVQRIARKIEELTASGTITGAVDISYPAENLLVVGSGLAFQDPDIRSFVDPVDDGSMREICHRIGLQIDRNRPLGTSGIASTVAFEHSLPRAMLPVLIFGAKEVLAEDGSKFRWNPLVSSMHVSDPAKDDKASYYCEPCPFRRK